MSVARLSRMIASRSGAAVRSCGAQQRAFGSSGAARQMNARAATVAGGAKDQKGHRREQQRQRHKLTAMRKAKRQLEAGAIGTISESELVRLYDRARLSRSTLQLPPDTLRAVLLALVAAQRSRCALNLLCQLYFTGDANANVAIMADTLRDIDATLADRDWVREMRQMGTLGSQDRSLWLTNVQMNLGVQVGRQSLRALMLYYAENDEPARALLEYSERYGQLQEDEDESSLQKAEVADYAVAFRACLMLNKPEGVLLLYDELVDRGLQPSAACSAHLVRASVIMEDRKADAFDIFEALGVEDRCATIDRSVWYALLLDMMEACRSLTSDEGCQRLSAMINAHQNLMDEDSWAVAINVFNAHGNSKAVERSWALKKTAQLQKVAAMRSATGRLQSDLILSEVTTREAQ